MTITRRIIKGTALTYVEMDENLRDLRYDTDLTRILENGDTTSLNATFNSTVTTDTLTTTALNVDSKTIKEYIEDTVGTMFSGTQGSTVTATYSDAAGTITISVDHPESANGGGGGGDTTIINQGATSLSELSDVSLGTLSNGQVLKYDGTNWVNGTDNSSGTGSSSFLGLSDTPTSFGTAGQVLVVNSAGTGLEFASGGGGTAPTSGTATFDSVTTASLTITGTGTTLISSGTDIELDATNRVRVIDTPFRLANMTTTQRNAFSAQNGDMIYNTSTNKAQVYANGSWVDLH